jgi:hypothetical protein
MTMKPEFKTAWIAALDSGEYRQGTAWLNQIDKGYCCLGVLCEVAGAQWSESPRTSECWYKENPTVMVDDGCCALIIGNKGELTSAGLEYFGISRDDQNLLIHMNDQKGYSFAAIADWIHDHL